MILRLEDLLRRQFPNAHFESTEYLAVGSFPEWTSLAHFNFLLLVEEHFGIRFTVEEMSEMKSLPDIRRKLGASGITA
jgi:acyl carrier protein